EMPGAEAEHAFIEGRADALLGWMPAGAPVQTFGGTLARLEAAGAAHPRIVWQSPILRYGAHAIRTDVSPRTRARLLAVLTYLHETERHAYEVLERNLSGGLRPVSHADYQAALDVLPPGP